MDQSNAETSSLCSLEHLRLSDSESNAAFRRDEPGRISITKKSESPCRGANSVNFVPCGEAVLIGRFCILDCVVGQKHCPLYRGCPLVLTKQVLVEVDYVSFVSCVTFALVRYGQL